MSSTQRVNTLSSICVHVHPIAPNVLGTRDLTKRCEAGTRACALAYAFANCGTGTGSLLKERSAELSKLHRNYIGGVKKAVTPAEV